MSHDPLIFTIFLIFTGAAVVATLALFARQALLIAYILIGSVLGPWGLGLVDDPQVIKQISHIGIIFLLFLIGLDLQPQELIHLVRKTTRVTILSSVVFSLSGFVVAFVFDFTLSEAFLIATAMSFSSTIVGLKLLPTTILHHQHTGEIIISILLLQDLIAIIVLLVIQAAGQTSELSLWELLRPVVTLPGLILFAWGFQRYLLLPLFRKFDQIQEYLFLMSIAWCLSLSELASFIGLSSEIGAFVAGVMLAASPIALFIAESLKPLRDFFLILFFFSLGASFDLTLVDQVMLPAVILAALALLIKPPVFSYLLKTTGEKADCSREVGWRLAQMSEFSLLIAVLAFDSGVIGTRASYLIQFATILSFLASSYLVVLRFQTPIALSDKLRRN